MSVEFFSTVSIKYCRQSSRMKGGAACTFAGCCHIRWCAAKLDCALNGIHSYSVLKSTYRIFSTHIYSPLYSRQHSRTIYIRNDLQFTILATGNCCMSLCRIQRETCLEYLFVFFDVVFFSQGLHVVMCCHFDFRFSLYFRIFPTCRSPDR